MSQSAGIQMFDKYKTLLAGLALLLVVAGAHWWIIAKYSSDVPWLDQWDAEAQGLYQPWHHGTLKIHDWFAPHNEHRPFFTRLLALTLLVANRQWDPRLQMVVDAVLYAFIAVGLFWALSRGRSHEFKIFSWVLLAVLCTFPYGVTNIVLGFQSGFYFLIAFAFIAIYALVNSRPLSLRWIAGGFSALASIFTMGSGLFTPVIAGAVLLCSILRSEKRAWQELRGTLITLVAAAVLAGVGFYFRSIPEQNASFRPKTLSEFGGFLLTSLSWPGRPMIILAVALWLPFLLFLANYLRRRTPDGPAERFVIGVGLWVLAQAIALVISRANSGEGLESRYTDLLGFGILANATCVAWLWQGRQRFRKTAGILALAWFAATTIGLYRASFNGRPFEWKFAMENRRAETAAFIATQNPQFLNETWLPYPDAKRLAALLQDPILQPILPAGIRKSLPLFPQQGSPAPAYVEGLSLPAQTDIKPDIWNWSGIFSRFAVLPASTRFEYLIDNGGTLPFLLFYVVGTQSEISIIDSAQTSHMLLPLPSGNNAEGRHAFAYCPTRQCLVRGATGPMQIAIMEPKEIGFFSVVALIVAQWGNIVFAAGVALALIVFFYLGARNAIAKWLRASS